MRYRLVTLLLCAACAADPVSTPLPSVSPAPTSSPSPGGLADGRHPGYLTSLDTAKLTLVVDVVELVTGETSDLQVRNEDALRRSLPVAPDAGVTVNTLRDGSEDVEITIEELAAYVEDGRAQQAVFHLTLTGGVVTEIREQYLP